jgi:threonine synthase
MNWRPLRHCDDCGAAYDYADRSWRCACGGTFSIRSHGEPAKISLGEGGTPTIPLPGLPGRVFAKLEFLAPTGSFKDRGAASMVARLRAIGVARVVDDSAGNGAVSMAAYCAAAGIACRIHAGGTNLGRLGLLRCYGAEIVNEPGRAAATAAAMASPCHFAAHAWDPFFIAGLAGIADEIVAQVPGVAARLRVVFPLGQGTLMLGLVQGFQRLVAAGRIACYPDLVAVQSDAMAPLYTMVRDGLAVLPALPPAPDAHAAGIAVPAPVRWRTLAEAFRNGVARVVLASDAALPQAVRRLGAMGLAVEPTAAVVLEALDRLEAAPAGTTVLVLTAAGRSWR